MESIQLFQLGLITCQKLSHLVSIKFKKGELKMTEVILVSLLAGVFAAAVMSIVFANQRHEVIKVREIICDGEITCRSLKVEDEYASGKIVCSTLIAGNEKRTGTIKVVDEAGIDRVKLGTGCRLFGSDVGGRVEVYGDNHRQVSLEANANVERVLVGGVTKEYASMEVRGNKARVGVVDEGGGIGSAVMCIGENGDGGIITDGTVKMAYREE